MAAVKQNSLCVTAFQLSMYLRRTHPAPQQDAFALQTLNERCLKQTTLGQWACDAPGGFAWLPVATRPSNRRCDKRGAQGRAGTPVASYGRLDT
ncbi:hypothetical protein [Pseudomonas qingdaonensis]|uniref:hypothetical protein n=1 Tax=Pseudomonas qingdaonensis TaxID=2056231 RepID=UPI00333F3FD1